MSRLRDSLILALWGLLVPLMALANQWFPFTPFMTDLKWAPLTGATVVTERAWNKIPVEFREELRKISQEEGLTLQRGKTPGTGSEESDD